MAWGVSVSTNGVGSSIVKEDIVAAGRGRPIRVICIGAGASGIYVRARAHGWRCPLMVRQFSIRLPRQFPNTRVDFQVRRMACAGRTLELTGTICRFMKRMPKWAECGLRINILVGDDLHRGGLF